MVPLNLYPRHGGQLKPIAERFGIPASQLLDFSANINPNGPSAAVIDALHKAIEDLTTITNYPDLESTELKESIAKYVGVAAKNVIVANGFVPLLEATMQTLTIRHCLLPVPCFVEYRKSLERLGIKVAKYIATADASFRYDPARLFRRQCDAILLANPQNPSGVCQKPALVREIIQGALASKIHVLLDEAFMDYVPTQSLAAITDEFPNLVVFRSVTKFHGIPGLRVAYAVTNPLLASAIEEGLPPWPITTLASRAVIAALGDQSYASGSEVENRLRRTILQRDITAIGLTTYPAAANFLLCRLPPEIDGAAFWQHMIMEHKIVVRSCEDYEGLPEGHFRVAVRTAPENSRLVAAIEASLCRIRQNS